MKARNLKLLSWVGLVLALLATVGLVITGILRGLMALTLFTPSSPEWVTNALIISAALIVAGLGLYAIAQPQQVSRFLTGRQARYGSNTLVMSLAFVGILIAVNVIAYQNQQTWDITEDKQHTLAPETLRALNTLPEPISATAFYSANMAVSAEEARKLLQDFQNNSKGKFSYTFIDPVQNPVAAQEAGITGDGKIVLRMGDRKEIVSYASETELVRAIIRLITPEQRVVYFLTGHGEADPEGSSQKSILRAAQALKDKNYTVKTLNLAAQRQIPEDARALVIAGPDKPLLAEEVSLVKSYLENGGALILLQDPLPLTHFGDAADPLDDYLRQEWGIVLDNDLIFDLSSNQPLLAITATYNTEHPVTRGLNMIAILPQARSLSTPTQPENVTQTSLVQTARSSWGETDFEALKNNQARFDEQADIPGPLTLAVAAENSKTNGKVVVIGNSSFIQDNFFDSYGNSDLFLNAVDWTAQQQNLIDITPRTPRQRTFIIPTQWQWVSIFLASICFLPGLIAIAGIVTWFARRRRG
uniref:Hypothetical conserved protein n=1 Tax=uncultured Chloroflexota bacterium TaxID=166587 RepID=H5SM35_9CHLR|nr:hypothetical conserved protein [uncultured Chloroflexota bacterium]BAL58039.1 hypothetical conserved protein [uncultured Chloroflexota bacterium]